MTQATTQSRRANNMVWFELPVSDLSRAVSFYETVFATKLQTHASFPELAIFPRATPDAVTGALTEMSSGTPSRDGAVVYLNCDGDLDGVLKRAQAAGGKVLQEVAVLPNGMGWTAQLGDLDGNRVGLHATF